MPIMPAASEHAFLVKISSDNLCHKTISNLINVILSLENNVYSDQLASDEAS